MRARHDEAVHAAETAALRLARQNRRITHRNARAIGMGSCAFMRAGSSTKGCVGLVGAAFLGVALGL